MSASLVGSEMCIRDSPLHVVGLYQHMGGVVTASGDLSAEARNRADSAKQATKRMGSSIFKNPSLDLPCKRHFHFALNQSRLCYNVCTWPMMSDRNLACLNKVYMSPIRMMT
eukprot:6526408-Alexandrium_andersonii.AAC.1